MNQLALNKKEKKQLKSLTSRQFSSASRENQKKILQLGAKDFSIRFASIIKKLATE
jgi:hypothetical protein